MSKQYLLSAIEEGMTVIFPKIDSDGRVCYDPHGIPEPECHKVVKRYLVPSGPGIWQWHWITECGKEIACTILTINNEAHPESVYTFETTPDKNPRYGFIDKDTFRVKVDSFNFSSGYCTFYQRNANPIRDGFANMFIWIIKDKVENEDTLMKGDISCLYKDRVFNTESVGTWIPETPLLITLPKLDYKGRFLRMGREKILKVSGSAIFVESGRINTNSNIGSLIGILDSIKKKDCIFLTSIQLQFNEDRSVSNAAVEYGSLSGQYISDSAEKCNKAVTYVGEI